MVGREKGYGYSCGFMPSVPCPQGCAGRGKERVSLSQCRYRALEDKPRAANADAKDQTAAEARASAGLHVERASRALSMVCEKSPALGKVLSDWLVYGEPEVSDNGPEVVDDRPTIRRDA